VKEENIAKSMLARYRWHKAITVVKVCQAFGPIFS